MKKVEISRDYTGVYTGMKVVYDGVDYSTRKYELSELLTGTEFERGDGVFDSSDRVYFTVCNVEKYFKFNKIDMRKDSIEEIAAEIKRRIIQVRDWVNYMHIHEKAEIEID